MVEVGSLEEEIPNRAIVMAQRGRGRGGSRRPKNGNEVSDLAEMMRSMMTRMDAIEAAQRRGIAHVTQNISDDVTKTERKEQEEKVTVE